MHRVRESLRCRVREQAHNAYNYARTQDPANVRASLLMLLRAVPEERATLFWLMATFVPERPISALVAAGRRMGLFLPRR